MCTFWQTKISLEICAQIVWGCFPRESSCVASRSQVMDAASPWRTRRPLVDMAPIGLGWAVARLVWTWAHCTIHDAYFP